MALFIEKIKARRELITLALMLECLHISIWAGLDSPLCPYLLAHLGFFLIWQPVWRSDEKLTWHNGLLYTVMALAFVAWINWWLMFAWIILLTGFCGGRVVINLQERINYMLVMIFLVSQLLIVCTTTLFNITVSENVMELFGIMLPVIPLIIILLPPRTTRKTLHSVDPVYALGTATLVSLLAVGSLLNMYRGNDDYLVALIETSLAIGLFLFVISWLLNPRAGFSGLSQLWLRSILNIGTPFESWLAEIANRFEQQNSPEEFLKTSIEDLTALPWVAGTKWTSGSGRGQHGEKTRYEAEIQTDGLTVCLYGYSQIGGALYFHCKLLVQLINNFHAAKQRERKLTQQAHLQAIYETGARITHDIKNLLQSLSAITGIIIYDRNTSSSVSQKLLERQLPHLTQRLQLALDKLQTPENSERETVYLKDWWQDLKIRTGLSNVDFQSAISADPLIPADLFDSVIENLFENLREKAHDDAGLLITVSMFSDENGVHLSICDNGKKIAEERANTLLNEPVKSDSGFGIGLYQAARLAEAMGYTLKLQHNIDGRVCFGLFNPADTSRDPVIQGCAE